MTRPWCNSKKKLGFTSQIQHHWVFLYSIINIDLNVPCYFASIEKMTNDYLIYKLKIKKDNCLFHIYMLKLNKYHMSTIHV
jgi:hypothetical protein